MIATPELGLGIVPIALLVAAGLGAFHALEPGHGKTLVAAYLVGARGTGWHAMVLGLVVTASHTAGVFLLGGVTLYASRHVMPEQLYPWLGALSGVIIAALGLTLFLRRFAAPAHRHHGHPHGHDHAHAHGHAQDHPHGDDHGHPHGHDHAHADPHDHDQSHDHGRAAAPAHAHDHGPGGPDGRHHRHDAGSPVSLAQLFALGVSGGIVPCPAALVVLLSAVSLQRVGFGLLLIVAFSVGLAAVLIGIGLLMVYARRFMSRFHGEGRVITRWLPLTSSAVVTVLGVAIAAQSLASAFRIGLG